MSMLDTSTASSVPEAIIIAPGLEVNTLAEMARTAGFQVTRTYQDLTDEIAAEVAASRATVVAVHEAVPNFSIARLGTISKGGGGSVKIVMTFIRPASDLADLLRPTGAQVFTLPARQTAFDQIEQEYHNLLVTATRRVVDDDKLAAASEQARAMVESWAPAAGGMPRYAMQTLTVFSSKGGVGKSLVASELAWALAFLGGRRVLLVDADMSRGYLHHFLGPEALAHASEFNLPAMAADFDAYGKISLDKHTFVYPAPLKGMEPTLKVLFGLQGQDQASRPILNGEQGRRFISALVEKAQVSGYEFVIFDIGTTIPIPVHEQALKLASRMYVVVTPTRGTIRPTRIGLDQMRNYDITAARSASAIVNMWSPRVEKTLGLDDIGQYLGMPVAAKIPAISLDTVQYVQLTDMLNLQAYISDCGEYADLKPMTAAFLSLSEGVAPGTLAYASQKFDAVRQLSAGPDTRKRGGLFGRR